MSVLHPPASDQPLSTKPLIRALSGEVGPRPPFWFMRQAGRYLPEYRRLRAKAPDFLRFCLDPDLAAEATLQPIRRFAMDGAIVFCDILVIPHALGQAVSFREGEGPVLAPVRDVAGLEMLIAGRARAASILAPVGDTLRLVRRDLPAETGLIGFCGAPWTVASYMVEGGTSRDHTVARALAYRDPTMFQRLIDVLVETSIDYLAMQAASGADALQIFDSWAGVLPEKEFERWCVRPVAAMIKGLRARDVRVPIIAFPRGAGIQLRDFAARVGADALGLDTTVPLALAREAQRSSAVQGNLDPVLVVTGGEGMIRACEDILTALGQGPLVFNLGHGLTPDTPPENVARLCDRLRAWRG